MDCQKHLFSLNPKVHYLNCAYKSPLLKAAERAAMNDLIKSRNPVELSIDDFFDEVDKVKEGFGHIVNCHSTNVAIIPSTTYGFSSVLNNIKPKINGHAITIKNEFPSGYFSLKRWCDNYQNDLIIIEPDLELALVGKNWNDKIINAIDQKTSIVLISSVHWMNGLKFDLKRIGKKCREVGAMFIVDGSQSVGALPMDVEEFNIDALICASYKWLFGPYSIALAYISDKFNHGIPLEESWMNRANAKKFSQLSEYDPSYRSNASRYNTGQASNFILMPILKEALYQLKQWQVSEIQSYCKLLIRPLIKYINELGIDLEPDEYFSNHLFALKLPPSVDENLLKLNLEKDNISISIRGESLRVSVNVFNDKQDIEKLIQVLKNSM